MSATRENIQKDADSIRIDSIRKADRIDKVKHSIKIIKAYLSAPNSAGGVDAHLVWKNVSKKTKKTSKKYDRKSSIRPYHWNVPIKLSRTLNILSRRW